MTIKVLIVDDSAVVRKVLCSQLGKASDIEVIAAVQDPVFAQRHMAKTMPDVIILDVEMPRMDGLTFLKKIMKENPLPVIMCSALTQEHSSLSVEALSAGAIEVIAKPKMNLSSALEASGHSIIESVRTAAKAKIKKSHFRNSSPSQRLTAKQVNSVSTTIGRKFTANRAKKLIAIGTSTGGTQALEFILPKLSANCPPIVIVQHMPEHFTRAFAKRLDDICEVSVAEGSQGEELTRGLVRIAPGGLHMTVQQNKEGLPFTIIRDGPPVNRHKPSVDVLFRSIAKSMARESLGIIMTGMGDDGASGLKLMREMGAQTYAQDEASSVVFGMPGVAIKIDAVDKEVSLEEIPTLIGDFS